MAGTWVDRFDEKTRTIIDWLLLYRSSDFEKTKEYCEQLIVTGTALHDVALTGFANYCLGEYYYNAQDFSTSLHYCELAYQYLKHSDALRWLSSCCNLLGCIYTNAQIYVLALDYYLQGLSVCEANEYLDVSGLIHVNLSSMYSILEDLDQTITYQKLAVTEYEREDSIPDVQYIMLCAIYLSLVDAYLEKQNLTQAQHYLQLFDEASTRTTRASQLSFYHTILHYRYIYALNQTQEADAIFEDLYTNHMQQAFEGNNINVFISFLQLLQKTDQIEKLQRLHPYMERLKKNNLPANFKRYIMEIELSLVQDNPQEELALYKSILAAYHEVQENEKQEKRDAIHSLQRRFEHLYDYQSKEESLNKDPLTGVYNRRYLDTYFEEKKQFALQTGENLAIGMIDMDYFKQYNDHYGHLKGDEALKKISSVFLKHMDANFMVARFGGDEFIAVMHALTKQEIEQRFQQLSDDLNKLDIVHETSCVSDHLTCSMGISILNKVTLDTTLASMIAHADELLYEVKNESRSHYHIKEAD